MAKPLPLQNMFSGGMKRDVARNRMPPNSAWDLVDLILDYGAPLRERGGWVYASNAITATTASAGWVDAGLYAVFSPTAGALPLNMAVDEDGLLYTIADNGTVTLVGSVRTMAQNPVFHGGTAVSAATAVYTGLAIFPDSTTLAVPKKFDGINISDLGGAPPKAKFASVYKDYTVLGFGSVADISYPNRIWFSQPGDPDCAVSSATAWDTTDSWIDFSLPIKALAATKNALLVFGDGQVSRIRGSTPPPDEDMVVDDPWQKVGIFDPFSITEYQDQVFWCAPEGVFSTDGVTLNDLTLKGGMLRYWLDMAADATTAWTFSTGIIRNKLVICVMNAGVKQDGFLVDLSTYAWVRISNLSCSSFWSGSFGVSDETFFGERNAAYVGRLGTMFDVDSSDYKIDGDGLAVASLIETPFYEMGRPGLKVVKALHVGYLLKDHGTDNPTITVQYTDVPDGSVYSNNEDEPMEVLGPTQGSVLSEIALSTYERVRLPLGGRFWGLGFKFTRAGAGDFMGFDLAAEVHHQEESKRIR